MSEYVVHFTKDSDAASALDNLALILGDGEIRAHSAFGSARNLTMLGGTQRSACFSEIPLDLLDRLIERRESSFGVGFHQGALLARGGARVWYLDQEFELAAKLRQLVTDQIGEWDSPLWDFTPFIDQPFDAPTGGYRFEWEREWRVPGGFVFDLDDVAFVFAPESDHAYLYDYLTQYLERDVDAWGPILVDPLWAVEELQDVFAHLPP